MRGTALSAPAPTLASTLGPDSEPIDPVMLAFRPSLIASRAEALCTFANSGASGLARDPTTAAIDLQGGRFSRIAATSTGTPDARETLESGALAWLSVVTGDA
jgi:hypothetical protein